MTSAVEVPNFAFSEMRPDTSKCSRGNKFNKTLTGFHQGAETTSVEKDNAAQQRAIMNGTGFNFRQNPNRQPQPPAPQDSSKPNEHLLMTQQPKITSTQNQQSQQPPQQNVFSSTSQGFYDASSKQNSFSKGMTLDQYFNFQKDSVPSNLMNEPDQELGVSNQKQSTTQSMTHDKSSMLSDEMAGSKLRNSSRGSQSQKSTMNQLNSNNGNNLQSGAAGSAGYFGEEDGYFQEDFEIHEESEEEDDDEEKDLQKSKRLTNENKLVNSQKRRQSRVGLFKSTSSMHEEDLDLISATNNTTQGVKNSISSRKKAGRRSSRELHEIDGDLKSGSIDDIPVYEDSQIQKRIRDKYFKKTFHNKPFLASNTTSTTSSTASTTTASTTTTTTRKQHPTCTSPISPRKMQHGASSNCNSVLSGSNADNIPFKTSTNFNNIPKPNMMNSTMKSSQAQTGHNFYAQQQQYQQQLELQQQQMLQETVAKSPTPSFSNVPANRKANRSQSPLHSFKRASNVGYSQQRQLSKEMMSMIGALEQEEENRMRLTFMNLNTNNNNNTQNGGHGKGKAKNSQNYPMGMSAVAGQTSVAEFENHIAFRSSFYSKAGGGLAQQSTAAAMASNNTNNNQNSKLRLTVNEFYKNPNKFQQQDTLESTHQQQQMMMRGQQDYLTQDSMAMMMRRTAKENKFLNQKDKIQEMAYQDASYITKHAARFNLNPNELAQMRQKN